MLEITIEADSIVVYHTRQPALIQGRHVVLFYALHVLDESAQVVSRAIQLIKGMCKTVMEQQLCRWKVL